MEHYNDTFKFDGAIAKQRPHMSVVLEPGSLVVFSGEAYSHYPHGISDKLVDSLVEAVAGTVVNRHLLADKNITEVVRKYRVGVTVRNLLPRCNHSPERAEYAMRRAWSIFHKERLEATTGETPLPQPQQQQLSGGSVSRPSSGSGVASTSTVGHSPSAEQLTRIEAKLDAVLMQQTELRTAVREVQEVVSMTTAASSSFRAEMSSILNHMSATVLQIESSVDELVASSSSNTGDT
jgi:alkylated DNA repair protein alkB family protein 6